MSAKIAKFCLPRANRNKFVPCSTFHHVVKDSTCRHSRRSIVNILARKPTREITARAVPRWRQRVLRPTSVSLRPTRSSWIVHSPLTRQAAVCPLPHGVALQCQRDSGSGCGHVSRANAATRQCAAQGDVDPGANCFTVEISGNHPTARGWISTSRGKSCRAK